MTLQLTSIWRYPVKSCRGEELSEAGVEPWGLAGDRRWMVVDESGDVVTAREHPRLLLVTPRLDGDGDVTLAGPDLPDLAVHVPAGEDLVPVRVHSGPVVQATPAGDKAEAWLTQVVGEPVRLVYLDDPTRRATDPQYSRETDRVSFADGYPLLLTSEESLEAVNGWIADGAKASEGPLPMRRFRPSVTVAGAEAWAEDGWRRLRIGGATFRNVKGCDRCVLTTIDPDTADKGHEPLFALARHRRWDNKIWFGVNLIPDDVVPGAVIRAGDEVEVLD
jgi:hypothetical protein